MATYIGKTQGFHGPVAASVTLDEQAHVIGIEADFNANARVGRLAIERMQEKMLATQSVEVDAVTGATSSSMAFKQAAKKAVALAQGEISAQEAEDLNFKLAIDGPQVKTGFDAEGTPLNTSDIQAYVDANDVDSYRASYDLVVIGSGGAGLAAAVQGAEEGLSVLVLEKAGIPGGTTNFSGGVVQASGTKYQKEMTKFKNDTAQNHADYYLQAAEGLANRDLVEDLTKHAGQNITWLEEMGVKWISVYGNNHVPYIADKVHADRIHVNSGGGAATDGVLLTQALLKNALSLGVKVSYENSVQALIFDTERKEVVGVKAARGYYQAKKAVLIATASIDHNPALAKDLSPQHYADLKNKACMSISTDTGDGLILGQSVNAALCGLGGTIDFDGRTGNATNNQMPTIPSFFVNVAGRRFVCEDATYAYGFREIFHEESKFQKPTYMIFADSSLKAPASPWNAESLAADIKKGLVVSADSIEDLAQKIGVDARGLAKTLQDWNELAAQHQDPEFGRQMGLEPLVGKYYAYQNRASNLGSLGGLKINVKGQVLDIHDQVIPGLYAAGLAAGGWMGTYYPGSGTALAGIIHQGRRAAHSIAQI